MPKYMQSEVVFKIQNNFDTERGGAIVWNDVLWVIIIDD